MLVNLCIIRSVGGSRCSDSLRTICRAYYINNIIIIMSRFSNKLFLSSKFYHVHLLINHCYDGRVSYHIWVEKCNLVDLPRVRRKMYFRVPGSF